MKQAAIMIIITGSLASRVKMQNNTGNNNGSSCDVRIHAYKNGKTWAQCKEEARKKQNYSQKRF
ncbi:MAG TPA: hypothetical protein VKA87_05485 [Nitrososphaeraceae archaeon]|nr:hypothetical protein [Nitrososphaeraceae archaeon]